MALVQYSRRLDFPSTLDEPTIAFMRGDVKTTLSLKWDSTASTSLRFHSDIQRSAKPRASILALTFGPLSELRYFRKVEFLHFHRGHYHVERFLSARPHRHAHRFDIGKHMDQALVEPEVAYSALQASVLHKKRTIASHAGEHFFKRLDLADVPQPGDQDSPLRRRNHLLDGLRITRQCEHNIQRHLSHLVRQWETVSGRLNRPGFFAILGLLHSLCGRTGVHDALDDPILHQRNCFPGHAFPIEGRSRLLRMCDIVDDRYVLAEQSASDSPCQKRPLIENRHPRIVPEHEAHDIEHCRGFQDHRVLPRRNLPWMPGLNGLLRGNLGQSQRIEMRHIRRIRLLPP